MMSAGLFSRSNVSVIPNEVRDLLRRCAGGSKLPRKLGMTAFLISLTSCSDLFMAIPKATPPVVGELSPGHYQITNSGSRLDNWANLYGDSKREAEEFCRPAGQTAHITAVDHHFEQRVRPLVVVTNFECVAN